MSEIALDDIKLILDKVSYDLREVDAPKFSVDYIGDVDILPLPHRKVTYNNVDNGKIYSRIIYESIRIGDKFYAIKKSE